MNGNPVNKDLTQITLSVIIILVLAAGSLWVFYPFIASLIWAAIIVISTYNFMLKLQKILWNKRSLAIAVMLLLILMVILVPILIVLGTIVKNSSAVGEWLQSLSSMKVQSAPEWITGIPVIGSQLQSAWEKIASLHNEEIIKKVIPFLDDIFRWFVAQAGSFGLFMVHFLVTVVLSGILYSKGEIAVNGLKKFATKLSGNKGDEIVTLAGQAIKAVTLGVVITAIIQSVLGGIGLAVTGVPRAGLLTAIMFILGIAQIGAIPVLIPAVIWKYASGDPVWGTILLIWSIIAGGSDNFIRPILIKRGANLPLLLIFAGVIGGLIAFGIVGLFIGPVILAVSYTLIKAWIEEDKNETA